MYYISKFNLTWLICGHKYFALYLSLIKLYVKIVKLMYDLLRVLDTHTQTAKFIVEIITFR
jgi:uncharacterized membrane protein YciS (DUF1049 family)